MTHLQILRALLQAGYSVTLEKQGDGYHVVVTGLDKAGAPGQWETADSRLDQAINQLMGFPSKDVQPTQM